MESSADNAARSGPVSVSVALPSDWTVNERQMCDLEMIISGAFAPLEGFMGISDYQSVLNSMTLCNGEVFPLPVVLAIPKSCCGDNAATNVYWMSSASSVSTNQGRMLLRDSVGTVIAELGVESVYLPDLEEEMEKVLGTTDANHPYVKYLRENHSECYYVGGKIRAVNAIAHFNFENYRMSPALCKEKIRERGFEVVVGFQTRNPLHRSHYELVKRALQHAAAAAKKRPMLLLTPVVGPTQPGDVPYYLRARCYEHVIRHFEQDPSCQFPHLCPTSASTPARSPRGHQQQQQQQQQQEQQGPSSSSSNAMLVLIPLAMRMAGPRECVLHARIRKNYGCTHFIVGRDHAGPSARRQDGTPFYGPYDAHKLLGSVAAQLGINPIFGEEMVYVGEQHGGYVPAGRLAEMQQQQQQQELQVHSISGTEFRRRLTARLPIPEWFSFPKVIEELQQFYKQNHERGLCVYFTGLPCSGKSTLANALEAAILENRSERRNVTLLDADVVRQHLSKGLGFSREDRRKFPALGSGAPTRARVYVHLRCSTNVRRIGYIASEITKHGGICIVANIAPYTCDREFNRKLIEKEGGVYVEVYVCTPLSVCEERDIKHLYKKARQGIIKQFTGVSDPYEAPQKPELTIDSSSDIKDKVAQVHQYLRDQGYVLEAPPLSKCC
ncbi:sulfate adenylyltransferas-adenylylsulfate kinase, putative [Eimeria tenella]|uniref:Sulfate adenylyltransferas-adenylylsulfate kinase, putative n=1 Tax=Eimeria tenella TaxID=5802 RepID=U6KZ59_EIMTE|nr:sulfate adenylyltransferas-adenylylsulfate kinase, putative [Eimeria tenella]CDJ42223.1 sulfate adenylyltransferas-adenylylsulfate kinase, putative [Eimeria tenella]|eukprot:XP_013232973.1 sulfate adenylyltransferas-adenylylsulfate kinase, putative [Eimeria tenella]